MWLNSFCLTFLFFSEIYCAYHQNYYKTNDFDNKKAFKLRFYTYTIPVDQDTNEINPRTILLKSPTFSVPVRGKNGKRRRLNQVEHVDPFAVSCRNVTASLTELYQEVGCKPRDTLVDLIPPLGLKVNPKTVIVKRCGGLCKDVKSCLSIKKSFRKMPVITSKLNSSLTECTIISLPEDEECRCGCAAKKRHCIAPNQIYDKNKCRCKCINMKDYENCILRKNYKWNEETCACKCAAERECTTGTVWHKTLCRCVKYVLEEKKTKNSLLA